MQAILSAHAVKPIIKALAALSKYGEDLDIHATPEHLSLSTTNSSKSAYGRFKIHPSFFESYAVDPVQGTQKRYGAIDEDEVQEVEMAAGQILTKSVLSILRHRGLEKTLERCEIAIVPGQDLSSTPRASGTTTSSTADSATSVLLIRLHCQHGVKKTHRLALSAPPPLMAPNLPVSASQSQVTIGPRAVKDLIDHFNLTRGKGGKMAELQLIWDWGEDEVQVRSLRGLLGGSDTQIATAITMDAEEFDQYDVPSPPVSLSFHLREFLAATTLAEGLSLQLNLSFSEPANPLSITIESDGHESLFVVCTRQPPSQGNMPPDPFEAQKKKRARQEDEGREQRKKPVKVVAEVEHGSARGQSRPASGTGGIPFRKPIPPRDVTPVPGPSRVKRGQGSNNAPPVTPNRPLFHPATPRASQRPPEQFVALSQADRDIIRQSGLGLEDMAPAEIAALLDADNDDEEMEILQQVDKSKATASLSQEFDWQPTPQGRRPENDLDEAERLEMELDPDAEVDQLDDEESFIPATQMPPKPQGSGEKSFVALDFGDD